MAALLVNIFMMGLLAATAVTILRLHRLFSVVMLSGAYSLAAAAQFVVLDAVDVAFTEAAVGAGISTILALATLSFVGPEEKARPAAIVPITMTLLVGGLLMLAVLDLPGFGSPAAPIHNHVAPDYIAGSRDDIQIPNIVTSVLASYRGYDTLGETIVVFTAAIAVLLILAGWTRSAPAPRKPRRKVAPRAKKRTTRTKGA